MARLQASLPTWAWATYVGDESAWEDAKEQRRTTLYAWAEDKSYGQRHERVSEAVAIEWCDTAHTKGVRQLGYPLRQAILGELDTTTDRPLILALIVSTQENLRTGRFRSLCDELAVQVGSGWDARQAFCESELTARWRAYPPAARGQVREPVDPISCLNRRHPFPGPKRCAWTVRDTLPLESGAWTARLGSPLLAASRGVGKTQRHLSRRL
jgi:hypothetical protein